MSFDRRAGAVAFVAGAIGMLVTVAFSSDPEPPTRHDRAAFAELVDLLERSEHGSWLVEFDGERTLGNGRQTKWRMTEARREAVHVVRDSISLQAQIGEVSYSCVIAGDEVQCLDSAAVDTLGTAEVVKTAVDRRAYIVSALPQQYIAGERARCFRVFAMRGYLPALGAEVRYCFAEDGVPLRTRVVTANDSRERTASKVVRDPSLGHVEALIAELEPEAAAPDSAAKDSDR